MRAAEQVTFGGGGLDRAAELRGSPEALAKLLTDPSAAVLPLWRGKPHVRPDAEGDTDLTLSPLSPTNPWLIAHCPTEHWVFLGRAAGRPWFAADLSTWEPEGQDTDTVGAFVDQSEQQIPDQPSDHRFAELRSIMTRLSALDAELAATARAVLEWHRIHGFCARCGSASEMDQAGWQRVCPDCGAHHFPRTDPVVIMLVTDGNSVLMGRSPGWPEGMYSLLAGFVEPGETIEAAVRRETFEEAGIQVGEVGYLASQPWPFPASLMFGCSGQALTKDIHLDPVELEDAIWVSRERMLAVYAGDDDMIKPARRGAIAHFLISRWLADDLD